MKASEACKTFPAVQPSLTRQAAFTRADLVAIIVVVALVFSFLATRFTGEHGRIRQCANNLKKLGAAMHGFAGENGGGLPPAAIVPGLPWDVQIKSYLQPGHEDSDSGYSRKEFSTAITPFFSCPSDHVSRDVQNKTVKAVKDSDQTAGNHARPSQLLIPRSYAMSKCDVETVGWPLSSDSATGLGVRWEPDIITTVLGNDFSEKAHNDPDSLPKVKLSIVSDPANTLLLTEFPVAHNVLGNIGFTTVESAKDQYARKENPKDLHPGGRNYLMVDGHVEYLTKEQAGGKSDQPAGIWTIKKGD